MIWDHQVAIQDCKPQVKARDDKRKQNEIQRQQKLKEESEAAAKAAKGRATEMEQKQFAFDSNGTVFFVQPVASHPTCVSFLCC